MGDILPGQLGLFPKGRDQGPAALHASQSAAGEAAEVREIFRAEIPQLMLLAVAPHIFNRIEFWRVRGQKRHLKLPVAGLDVLVNSAAAVRFEPIPDDEQLARQLPPQVAQEVHDLGALDGARIKPEVKGPYRHPGHHRQPFPVERQLHHRRLTAGCPSPDPMRPLAQARLVDEDDRAPLAGRVFFNRGHSTRFQRRIAASSRSRACLVGRWQLQPRRRSRCQTQGLLYRTPHWFSINFPTRPSVQRPVAYPWASGPAFKARSTRVRSAVVSAEGRPARGARRRPRSPWVRSMACHRLTDCRETPTRRATSAGWNCCRNNLMASRRRCSNASKSRRGAMVLSLVRSIRRSIPQAGIIVTLLINDQ